MSDLNQPIKLFILSVNSVLPRGTLLLVELLE
jgi:hypothetical protein